MLQPWQTHLIRLKVVLIVDCYLVRGGIGLARKQYTHGNSLRQSTPGTTMARRSNRTIRKEANRGSPSPTDTGMADSNRIRLSSVQRPESEPATSRPGNDSVVRAKTDFIGRATLYQSTRGRIPQEKDIRFQPIVIRDTHERIRAARRRLKHVPFCPNRDIPRAVSVDFVRIHAHDCGAYNSRYSEVKNGKHKKK